MSKSLKLSWFRGQSGVLNFVVLCLLLQNLVLCCSLNEEGKALLKLRDRIVSDPFGALSNWVDEEAVLDPCNWFGVECTDGRVVVLNLKDLCLGGTLAPELVNLVHIKSIILRNNSFSGTIPEGIVELKELEILDLGYNNFSGHIPDDLGSNISLAILLLDNNELLVGFSPEINELKMLSEYQVDESQLTDTAKMAACKGRSFTRHVKQSIGIRSLQQIPKYSNDKYQKKNNNTEAPKGRQDTGGHYNRADTPPSPTPSPAPSLAPPTSPTHASDPRPNSSAPGSGVTPKSSSSKNTKVPILAGAIGGIAFLLISSIVVYLFKTNKVVNVRPWATGLSGQLQKAFVTGVPKLKISELEVACEGFSNVIGTSPIGTVFKGTLSSGVEIAVASVSVTSFKDWSKNLEAQFRKKIDTLSKVNHKNFVNLIGYCDEDEPFTRMIVFEYAPNGTLFEHLHIKEAEHLDWRTRLRVATGMAYCLQYMHQLDPPMTLINLNSSAINLTEDYAAKISDFRFTSDAKSGRRNHINTPSETPESNVYNFGVILFEMVTGRLPYAVDNNGSHENWASHYLQCDNPIKEMVDPTLASYQEEQLEQVAALIESCCHPDSEKRPTMKEVSARLREITKLPPEAAVPRLNPLWWAEIEISSAEAS